MSKLLVIQVLPRDTNSEGGARMTDWENFDVNIAGTVPEIAPKCTHTPSCLLSVCTLFPPGDRSSGSFPFGGCHLRVDRSAT